MLQIWDVFELKSGGTALYCKDDKFDNMTKDEIRNYFGRASIIKIYDKDLNERKFKIKGYDVASSISNKIAVAFLVDKKIDNGELILPTEVNLLYK
jgi:hypothetical protein